MKIRVLLFFCVLLFTWTTPAIASQQEEINYLLEYGQKVLIEGARRGERKWDRACRLVRKSNYLAIVQSDGSSYRIVPAPTGQIVEKICPSDVFADAISWFNKLHKRR